MGLAISRFDKLPKAVSLYLFFVDLRTRRRLGSRLWVLAPSVRRKAMRVDRSGSMPGRVLPLAGRSPSLGANHGYVTPKLLAE